MRQTIRGDSSGADALSRGGEAKTVTIAERRCLRCGGRLQVVVDRTGEGKSPLHCRGCGRAVPA